MTMLKPRDTIGILGGGQLGRMIALAAAELGLRTLIYQPDEGGPAFEVATGMLTGAYDDEEALAAFAARCDVITYEFENVPAEAVAFLAGLKPVRPGLKMLTVSRTASSRRTSSKITASPLLPIGALARKKSFRSALWRWGAPAS